MSQQATISRSPKPLSALTGLARQIALPHEYKPERFPSFPALERTATMGFNYPFTWTAQSAGPRKAMLCRQAAYPLWVERNYTNETVGLTWTVSVPAIAGAYTVSVTTPPVAYASGNTTATSTVAGITGASVPDWTYPTLGVDLLTGSAPYVYVPTGFKAYFYFAGDAVEWSAGTNTYTLEADVWISPGETVQFEYERTLTSAVRGASFVLSAPAGSWIRPKTFRRDASAANAGAGMTVGIVISAGTPVFTPSAANAGTWAITAATAVALVPASAPADFTVSTLPWTSTRVTAVSGLFTNTTQVLNKGGTVLCGRVSPTIKSPWAVASTDIQGLHPAEKAYLALETGAYSYVPPSTDMSEFFDYTTSFVGGQVLPCYALHNNSMVNFLFFQPNTGIDAILAVNLDWHVEFRTSSVLFPIGLSGLTIETLHQAQLVLAKVGFFFENFSHVHILSALTAAARVVLPALGLIQKGSIAAKALKAGKTAYQMSSKPPRAPPATTGQRSGFNGPQKKKSGIDMYFASRGMQVPSNKGKKKPNKKSRK